MMSNIYNNLLTDNLVFDKNIQIQKIDINKNSQIFDIAYQDAIDSFFKELTKTLESQVLYLYGKHNIITPNDQIQIPTYHNKYSKNFKIFFKKNIFLRNYEFIKKIKEYYLNLNLSIDFFQIDKYNWKKVVTKI